MDLQYATHQKNMAAYRAVILRRNGCVSYPIAGSTRKAPCGITVHGQDIVGANILVRKAGIANLEVRGPVFVGDPITYIPDGSGMCCSLSLAYQFPEHPYWILGFAESDFHGIEESGVIQVFISLSLCSSFDIQGKSEIRKTSVGTSDKAEKWWATRNGNDVMVGVWKGDPPKMESTIRAFQKLDPGCLFIGRLTLPISQSPKPNEIIEIEPLAIRPVRAEGGRR